MCTFCEKIKKALKDDYRGVELEYPIRLTYWGIKCDDDEYVYSASIEWNFCPECGAKIK